MSASNGPSDARAYEDRQDQGEKLDALALGVGEMLGFAETLKRAGKKTRRLAVLIGGVLLAAGAYAAAAAKIASAWRALWG